MTEWTEYVKRFAQLNDITYACALSMPECKEGYRVYKERLARQQKQSVKQPAKQIVDRKKELVLQKLKDFISRYQSKQEQDLKEFLKGLKESRQPKAAVVQPVRTSLKARMKAKIEAAEKPVEKIDELDLLRRLKLEEEEKQRDRLDREQMKQEAFKKDKKETVRKATKQEERALEEYLKSLDEESKLKTIPKIKRKNF